MIGGVLIGQRLEDGVLMRLVVVEGPQVLLIGDNSLVEPALQRSIFSNDVADAECAGAKNCQCDASGDQLEADAGEEGGHVYRPILMFS